METYEQKLEKVARAMRETVIRDDEGEFPRLFDLLGFSGENKAHTVVNGLARAALAALGIADTPPAPAIRKCADGCPPCNDHLCQPVCRWLAEREGFFAENAKNSDTAPAPAISGGEMVSVLRLAKVDLCAARDFFEAEWKTPAFGVRHTIARIDAALAATDRSAAPPASRKTQDEAFRAEGEE